MTCICEDSYLKDQIRQHGADGVAHSVACDEASRQQRDVRLYDKVKWLTQTAPCSGTGYAHSPHGACPGYARDRT